MSLMGNGCGNAVRKDAKDSDQLSGSNGPAELVFREYEHNFGKVSEGEKLAYVFTFENKGTGTLVISNATTSCGCTVPKFDDKPISPGKEGSLEVVFNTSGFSGMQSKTVKVMSNASVPVVVLKITAEVITTKSN